MSRLLRSLRAAVRLRVRPTGGKLRVRPTGGKLRAVPTGERPRTRPTGGRPWALPAGAVTALTGAAAILAGVVAALAVAVPAWAHGTDAPDGTDYRTAVDGVGPAVPGLAVRAIEAGGRLELDNRTGRTIEVLGYAGEPYLEVRPDGVHENVHSPATYLNTTITGDTAVPATADPTLPPEWRRVSDEPVARWHDQRTHWMDATPPPQVAADPSRTHRVRDWVVPLRDGTRTIEVRGTLDWVPPPTTGLWWLAVVLGAVAVGLIGLPAGRRWTGVVLGGAAIAGGAAAVGYAVARQVDAGATGVGAVLLGLLVSQMWPVLAGLGAIAAGGYALARRAAADFALALAGACLALFAGLANLAVFTRSVAPVPWPAWSARLVVATVLAAGAGLAVAGALRLRAASRTAVAAAAPTDT